MPPTSNKFFSECLHEDGPYRNLYKVTLFLLALFFRIDILTLFALLCRDQQYAPEWVDMVVHLLIHPTTLSAKTTAQRLVVELEVEVIRQIRNPQDDVLTFLHSKIGDNFQNPPAPNPDIPNDRAAWLFPNCQNQNLWGGGFPSDFSSWTYCVYSIIVPNTEEETQLSSAQGENDVDLSDLSELVSISLLVSSASD